GTMGEFIETTRYADQPRMVVLAGGLFECLSRESSVGNSRAAAKRVIAERWLPVVGKDQLGAIQELGFLQEGPSEVGAIEHGFEEVRLLQIGIRQVRLARICSSEIGTLKIRLGEVKSAQIEPAQTGPRQVRRLVPLVPPCIPCRSAFSNQG